MKKYRIQNNSERSYTVTLGKNGIIDVDGLPVETANALKATCDRHIKKNKLSPAHALGRAVGSYATVIEIDAETTVSDLT